MPQQLSGSLADLGGLQLFVTSSIGFVPIPGAAVTVSLTRRPEEGEETFRTDKSGQTGVIPLPAPSPELGLSPSGDICPYAEYTIQITAPGYEPVRIEGAQVLPLVTAVQQVSMVQEEPQVQMSMTQAGNESQVPITQPQIQEDIEIPPHVLFGDYPAKLPEAEIKPSEESGEIVLSRVVIPEYIVVHDGLPDDISAPDYYVRYRDYIKNVAASEIYATWPESAIYANILAIMSFTLNRVYTEWYRNQGYPFTITSSTAYDQKWVYGRNTYANIDRIVDSVFANYLSRPGVRQPIFTSYCDGQRVTCSGLSQWGSKYLGEQNYSAIEIIRYYYGSDIYINTAAAISGIPSSFPGYNLSVGAAGDKVRQMQEQLLRISQNFPAIPKISADGVFGLATAEAVRAFQKIFLLPANGIVDYPTWYQISEVYVAVTRIAEPG